MESRTRALATDFALAAGALLAGGLTAGGPAVWNIAVVGFGGALAVGGLYLAEQTPVLTLVERHSPVSHLVAFAVTLAVGLVLVLGWTVLASPAGSLLLGLGIGLGCYRTVYGIYRPLPDSRLAPYETLDIDPPR